jgi:ABC-type multidrug transport system fused ATPase/permease subunit
MDAKLIRYYKKKLYGGRSTVARFMDYVVLRFMLLFTLFIILLYFSRSFTVSLLISIFLTLTVSLILVLVRRNRIHRYIERDMSRIKQKCLLEELTMMTIERYTDYFRQLVDGLTDISPTEYGFTAKKDDTMFCVFHNHPSSKCDVGDILKVVREYAGQNTAIVSLSDFNEAAKTFAAGQGIKLISGQSVLKAASDKDMLPDEEVAQEKARREMSDTIISLDRLKQSAFNKTKIKAYILCGLIIMCWSFVMGFHIFYPIIAVLCFVMAAVTFRRSKLHEESHGIGIS